MLQGVAVELDDASGKALSIARIREPLLEP
jgi:calcineurin-like phosphoesterase